MLDRQVEVLSYECCSSAWTPQPGTYFPFNLCRTVTSTSKIALFLSTPDPFFLVNQGDQLPKPRPLLS